MSKHQYKLSSNPRAAWKNVKFLIDELLLSSGDFIILGAEPYSKRVVLFERLATRHDVVLHTSWPYWGGNNVPQPTSSATLREHWQEFLNNVHAVGVTEAATESIRNMGVRTATHIPHAVNTETYHPDAGREPDRRSVPVVSFVGRLERRKGIPELLNIISEWDGPDVVFRFVGDGPLASEVETAAESEIVEYEGYVTDSTALASLYATSEVLALPSLAVEGWEELFGIVVIEAFASGVPVVATDCVGPRELITEGATGFVVPQRDKSALADRIERVVADSEKQAQMARNARKAAEERYSKQATAAQWESVIESLRPSG